jgi:hypothetical protein
MRRQHRLHRTSAAGIDKDDALVFGQGVSMQSQLFIRASGPTRYQPASGPSDWIKGNFI